MTITPLAILIACIVIEAIVCIVITADNPYDLGKVIGVFIFAVVVTLAKYYVL